MTEAKIKRGRTHNAEGAREAILNAAEKIFSEHGFAGARIDDIAAEAGYNKGLIFRYFGDKLRLYLEIIRRADVATREIQTRAVASLMEDGTSLNPESVAPLLRKSIGEVFDFYCGNPQMMHIFQWEMAEGWQNYRQIAGQIDSSDIDLVKPLMAKLQETGLLRSDFDPLAQYVTITFVPMLFLACLPFFQVFSAVGDGSVPGSMDRAREFVMDFVTGGLLAGPSGTETQIHK